MYFYPFGVYSGHLCFLSHFFPLQMARCVREDEVSEYVCVCVGWLVHNVLYIFLLYSSLSHSIHIQVSTDNDFSRINFFFLSSSSLLLCVSSHINLFARILYSLKILRFSMRLSTFEEHTRNAKKN